MNLKKLGSIHSPRPTFQNPNLIKWEKLFPNLSFIVENKTGNSHKKGWSHFKININN